MAGVRFLKAMGLVALTVISAQGCAASRNSCGSRYEMQCQQCSGDKDHVHVVFVDSPIDIGHWGAIPQISNYVRSLGYRNVVYYDPGRGNMGRPLYPAENSCSHDLAQIVLDARAQDPDARFMMIGWSAGCLYVHDSLKVLQEYGESVETVVYLDSEWLEAHMQGTHPENVGQVACVYRPHTKLLKKPHGPPAGLPANAVVYDAPPTWHIRVAMEPQAMDALVAELTDVTTGATSVARAAPATESLATTPQGSETPVASPARTPAANVSQTKTVKAPPTR